MQLILLQKVTNLGNLGDLVDVATLRPGIIPLPREEEGELVGEVLWVDRYGNCQLNVDPDEVEGWGDIAHD